MWKTRSVRKSVPQRDVIEVSEPPMRKLNEKMEDGRASPNAASEHEQEKERITETSTPPTSVGSVEIKQHKGPWHEESIRMKAVALAVCFIGLQASYITWGIVQEIIMTQRYGEGEQAEHFRSSAFLVFSNRFLGLLLSGCIVYCPFSDRRKRTLRAPLLQFAPSSLSNILSSWAQYEALKYVSFPTQVLSKSSKIIPVMLVGRFVNRKSYPCTEYVEAALITAGVALFSLNEKKPKADHSSSDSLLGYLLLAMYLTCDSFTSQWQDKVFKKHHVTQFQMMLGINVCSMFFTGLSLLQTGQGWNSWLFLLRHPDAMKHIVLLSISSCVGQLFIFYAIKRFGALVFTIMMTIRQMLSMVFSCLLFGHPMAWPSVLGASICFSTLGYRIRRNLMRSKGNPPSNN